MACAAVLIPCQSGAAEVLPQDIVVDEVLQVTARGFAA